MVEWPVFNGDCAHQFKYLVCAYVASLFNRSTSLELIFELKVAAVRNQNWTVLYDGLALIFHSGLWSIQKVSHLVFSQSNLNPIVALIRVFFFFQSNYVIQLHVMHATLLIQYVAVITATL